LEISPLRSADFTPRGRLSVAVVGAVGMWACAAEARKGVLEMNE
jgi:hypothetical protein